jgi:hypothetical protein
MCLNSIKTSKISSILLISLVLFSLYSGIVVVAGTSSTVRYKENYVKALEWIKNNTDENAVFMTVFCGSGEFYSQRHCIWPVKDLPELMTTNSEEKIIGLLKKYKIKYILIQASLTGENYIAPGTNIMGVFTYRFVKILNKSDKFEIVYTSNDSAIYAPGLVLPNIVIYKVL